MLWANRTESYKGNGVEGDEDVMAEGDDGDKSNKHMEGCISKGGDNKCKKEMIKIRIACRAMKGGECVEDIKGNNWDDEGDDDEGNNDEGEDDKGNKGNEGNKCDNECN